MHDAGISEHRALPCVGRRSPGISRQTRCFGAARLSRDRRSGVWLGRSASRSSAPSPALPCEALPVSAGRASSAPPPRLGVARQQPLGGPTGCEIARASPDRPSGRRARRRCDGGAGAARRGSRSSLVGYRGVLSPEGATGTAAARPPKRGPRVPACGRIDGADTGAPPGSRSRLPKESAHVALGSSWHCCGPSLSPADR